MQYMKALFVSEEPDQDAPEKMADLLDKYEKKTSRASRIIGLTGPDVNAVSPLHYCKDLVERHTVVVDGIATQCLCDEVAAFASANVQVRQMVNQFNQKSVAEGKTSLVEAGDPDGSLFLVNPEVRGLHW